MLVIALTGNIATGKSTVADAFAARGATVIDSDAAARAAVAPGTPALAAIAQRFGSTMLLPDGSLDRTAMGRLVFTDADARRALEGIVHPAVEAVRVAAIAAARRAGVTTVVCDIPLLFEAKLAWQFPRIVMVDAPASVRIDRLVRVRRMRREDAESRVRAQLPASLKRPRVDAIIDNASDMASLDVEVERAWQRIAMWGAVAASNRAA